MDTEHKNLVAIRDISKDSFDKKLEFTPIVTKYFAEFSLVHTIGTKFFFKTNMNAPKGKIVMFDFNKFDKTDPLKSLQTVIPEHPKNPIAKHVSVADNKMIVTYLVDASDRV
jgi:prolyl oligopeptidase